jgi:SHS2 domain-containing protein
MGYSSNCSTRSEKTQWYTENMHPQSLFGFREVSHTADWELEVWAPDLGSLLEQAARGMYYLTGLKLSSHPRLTRKMDISFLEPETLLIDFLTELIYLTESEGLAFDEFDFRFTGDQLIALVHGAKIDSLSKEIKAATYHNLEIREFGDGLVANIVFDV